MPLVFSDVDLKQLRQICIKYFKGRGYKMGYNSKIHPLLYKSFHLTAKDARSIIGIEIIRNKNHLDSIVTCKKMLSDPTIFKITLEIIVVWPRSNMPIKYQTLCKKTGLGLYVIEDNKIQEILQPSFEIKQAKIEKQEIMEILSSINIRAQALFSFKIFDIKTKDIEKMSLHCKSEGDLTNMIANIALIIDSIIGINTFKKMGIIIGTKSGEGRPTEIDYLEEFLKVKGKNCDPNAFKFLRSLKQLRNNRRPIHRGRDYKKICKELTGNKNPDHDTLASCCVSKFLNALYYLRDSLS